MERVRSMLSLAKLPKPFWGEAVRTACYLINRSPLAPLNFEVPEKMWSGKNPSYSHLRVFGCIAFAHVSKELRQKLDARTTPCIFIGYGDEEFGYRLWDSKEKKVIRSRDVVFHESQTIQDIEKPTMSQNPDVGTHEDISRPRRIQFVIDDNLVPEEISEAEEEEETEGIEQGEPQPPLPEAVGPSQGSDDGETPEVRRSERGRIPSTRYPESEYILLTEDGEPKIFKKSDVCNGVYKTRYCSRSGYREPFSL